MITLLIGHRGSGKTSLLRRLEQYCAQSPNLSRRGGVFIDLDQWIERREGRTIGEIFSDPGAASGNGERHFRDLERAALRDLCRERAGATTPTFIALGAGFEGPIPAGARCVRVRRPSDSSGRIFLDLVARPRLEKELSPLDEFRKRAAAREARFDSWADEEWTLAEGFEFPHVEERFFFDLDAPPRQVGGIVTLLPRIAEDPERRKNYVARRKAWGVRLEIRDDLIDDPLQDQLLASLPPDRVLYSIRRSRDSLGHLKPGIFWDWALELGEAPRERPPSIVSLHQRQTREGSDEESVGNAIRRLEAAAPAAETLLKLAIVIRDFNELAEGHLWARKDLRRRAFLPRSPEGESGRWAWYRLITGRRMPLAFFRDTGSGSAVDQPALSDWLRFGTLWNRHQDGDAPIPFAAILGDPVTHSRTPGEQWRFFAERGLPVLPVRVTEAEWRAGALEILRKLGLRAASVTSPLKLLANQACTERTEPARRFNSVNTLSWSTERGWVGHNTDIDGLRALFVEATLDPATHEKGTAVWGAGGTLPLLESLLPGAYFYSARTGEERRARALGGSPRFVIWGVGRSQQKLTGWPPPIWKPECVIDLNYADDSPGREYAQACGARYVTGLPMFEAQAAAQREFWKSTLRRHPT